MADLNQHKLEGFICPLCHSPLVPHSKTWRCDGSKNAKHTKHSFDVAKQGYINLLPVQHKKSKIPGDSAASTRARHRFLSAGHYEPLLNTLLNTIKNLTVNMGSSETNNLSSAWLDVGCGEGYYTLGMAEALSVNHIASMIAVDISKPAVMQLAKTVKQAGKLWTQTEEDGIYPLVASASKLPLADSSVMGISSIFSPILPAEFARVMQTGGRLIIAKPDVGHLANVREALFDTVRPHDSDKFLDELTPFFELKRRDNVSSTMSLDADTVADLLTMTPYSYRAPASKREALLERAKGENGFETHAHFVVYELEKLDLEEQA